MTDSRQPWERRTGESAKAYAAFWTYCQLPAAERSIDAAWRRAKGRAEGGSRADGQWRAWAAAQDWVSRAAASDEHLAACQRQEQEALWRRQVDEYAEQQRRLHEAALKGAVSLLAKTNQRLAQVEAGDIPLALVPQLLRTAAALAETASSAQAQTLALAELMRRLDEQHPDP